MTAFAGRLHGPGHPDSGTATTAAFAGSVLQVAGAPPVPAAQVRVEAGGFNQEDVVLAWTAGGAEYALFIQDPAAKQSAVASAPPELAPRLKRWQRGVRATNNFWLGVAALSGTAALALGIGIWRYDEVVAWTASHLSMENERRLGQGVMDGIKRQGKLVDQGKALDAIREVGGKLTAGSRYKYEWHLVDDPSINAFAVPGGFVVVHTGLVNSAGSAEELAGVLAHEVQHVEQRHALQALLYQLGWAALLTVVLGDPSAATTIVLLQVGNLKFSRDLEAQADALGIETLRKAGIPPEGMAQFFRKMQETGGGAPPAWLSTHPDTADRVAAVDAALAAAPCPACAPLPLDWAAVKESLYTDGLIRRPGGS